MKRLLMVLALAGFAAAACGDDDDDDDTTVDGGGGKADSGPAGDSGARDSGGPGVDAGPYTPVPNKVTNVAAACTAVGMCMGTTPKCATSTALGTTYPGGYCSADCRDDVECGTGGACPVGEAAAAGQPIAAGSVMGDCYKTCTSTADCRTGYTCTTVRTAVASVLPSIPANANFDKQVCLPGGGGGDAGADAGRTSDAGGIDSGS